MPPPLVLAVKPVERPPDEEMDRILETYGRIRRRVVDWDLRHLNEDPDYPPCVGEVVLLILDNEGRLATVRKQGSEHWILPMGRIAPGETVEEAAAREAKEETGWEVRVEEVRALHRARIRFQTWRLERWYFVVVCRALQDEGGPQDTEEIAEAQFVRLPSGIPIEWVQSEWYLWCLKDADLLHPHAFLIGRADGG